MLGIYHNYKKDFRSNLRLAWPIIAGQIGHVTVAIADNIMVGRLGAEELAAISLGVAIFTVFFVIGMGISFALPPIVAEADGRKDHSQVSAFFAHSMVINVIFAIINIVLVELCIPLYYRLGQEEAVVDLMIPYLRYSTWSMLPFMVLQTYRCLSDGLSRTVPPMISTLIGNAINIILNYLLIFGKAGLPQMGVGGAGLATLIARIFMLMILVLLLSRIPRIWQYAQGYWRMDWSGRYFRRILRLGVPTSLQMFFEVGVFSGSTVLMGIIGAEAQAAHQIALNLITVSFMFCYGLSVAGTIRVGNAFGSGDKSSIRNAGFSSMIQSGVFMFISAIILVLTRDYLPLLYISDGPVVDIASTLLILAAVFQVSDGVQVTAIGALRGIQDVRYPTWVTFFAYILIGMTVAYVATFALHLGPTGIWIGLLVGLTVAAVLNGLRFHRLTS